jgi:hypothetical protein
MKLMLIYAVLDSYYHVSVLKDRSQDRFTSSEFNSDTTEVLLNKLFSIRNKSFIDISKNNIYSVLNFYRYPPILFVGESGVGKTEIMRKIVLLFGDQYYIPTITVTRLKRQDDDFGQFEYVDKAGYLKLLETGEIVFDTPAHNENYGYRIANVKQCGKIPLMNASPFGLLRAISFPCFRIMIDGDSDCGLEIRGSDKDGLRKFNNEQLRSKYYADSIFRQHMDHIFLNTFEDADVLARSLEKKIYSLVCKRRGDLF